MRARRVFSTTLEEVLKFHEAFFPSHNQIVNCSLVSDESTGCLFFLKKTFTSVHTTHTSVDTKGQRVHFCSVAYTCVHERVCVYVCVCACAPRRGSLQPATRAWSHIGFTQGSLYGVETPFPSCLLTASCHNHQMPTDAQISGSQPPRPQHTHTLPMPGCGGSQRGIISHRGGAMLLQTLL